MNAVGPLDDVRAALYKAKIDSVSPASRRNTFEDQEECFLGVSLENPMFERPKLESIVEWVSRRFTRCTVLIGDSIHRLTLQSVHDLGTDESRARAQSLGAKFVDENRDVLGEFRDRTKFEILTCGEVQQWHDYEDFYERLWHEFNTDSAFHASVESFARWYHERRWIGVTEDRLEHRVAMSSQYFLEEFAIFSCLQDRGISVMVYPGSFSTLTEIAAGDHPRVPSQLKDLTVVSLHLKSRRKKS